LPKRCDRAFAVKIEELDMRESRLSTDAGQQYATAYESHYTAKDIHKAFTLYEDIIATHPDTKEAGYSRSQIQNVVNAVVLKKKSPIRYWHGWALMRFFIRIAVHTAAGAGLVVHLRPTVTGGLP
jgi:hypothetical protein